MKEKDYPKKIYCSNYKCPSEELKDAFLVMGASKEIQGSDNIEYVRADIVQNQLELEYKRGICEGEDYPIWHKYPNEKPTKTALYIVTRAANMGEYQVWVTSEYYNAKSEMLIENGLDDISNQILAWMELPEPYEE